MKTPTVCRYGTGRYEISTGVTRKDLEKLAANPETEIIQFVSPLPDKVIDSLEETVFSKRRDILLRAYDYREPCDLTFLERIPSLRKLSADSLFRAEGIETVTKLEFLEDLNVGIFNLDNFDFLDGINPNLKELGLQPTNSKKPKIDGIARFQQLEHLYLEGQQKGIEAISQLQKLQRVTLRSISTGNMDYLKGLKSLWSVDVKLGGIKNFDALTTLPKIKRLELWLVRDLANLSFISKLPTLQNLFVESLKQAGALPDFSENISLRRIHLENMKGLKDLSALRDAPNLKEFIFLSAVSQKPEDILPALENPNVTHVLCAFGSDRKNNRFEKLAKQYGKSIFEYSE